MVGLGAHVGEQVDGRLLHRWDRVVDRIGGAGLVPGVRVVETPGPLDGSRAEHERAARRAVQGEVVGGGGLLVAAVLP